VTEVTEEEAIRGFRVVKKETMVLEFDQPGEYVVPEGRPSQLQPAAVAAEEGGAVAAAAVAGGGRDVDVEEVCADVAAKAVAAAVAGAR
jgi:hypothetical protein